TPQGDPGREVHVEPRTTEDVAATLRMRGQNNHAIPAARPLHLPDAALPIDPYVLGCLLGGGGSRGTGRIACDPEDLAWLVAEFCALGYDPAAWDPGHFGVRGLRSEWRSLGLTAGKHIPAVYLRASFVQRLALAQGLIDSGGYVDDHGAYRFSNTNKQLADGFAELALSLGCVTQLHRRGRRTRLGGPSRESPEVIVPTALPLARLPRKALAARHVWKREQVSRDIVGVRPVPSVAVRC